MKDFIKTWRNGCIDVSFPEWGNVPVVYYSSSQACDLESLAAFLQIWVVVGVNVTALSFFVTFFNTFVMLFSPQVWILQRSRTWSKIWKLQLEWSLAALWLSGTSHRQCVFSLYQYISRWNLAFYMSEVVSQIAGVYSAALWKSYVPNTTGKNRALTNNEFVYVQCMYIYPFLDISHLLWTVSHGFNWELSFPALAWLTLKTEDRILWLLEEIKERKRGNTVALWSPIMCPKWGAGCLWQLWCSSHPFMRHRSWVTSKGNK